MKNADWLSEHRKIVTSQYGEDGVIEKIFEIIEPQNKWCVEFGAGDGKTASNVWSLIMHKGWSSVLIESNQALHKKLCNLYRNNPNVVCIKRKIDFIGNNALEKILSSTPIPRNFDFLSIDIDGNDYHVWNALELYKPNIVVIEFNPSIPIDIEFVQARNMKVTQGSSLFSITILAKKKGYELISTTDNNAFFCKKELFPSFEIEDNSLSFMRKNNTFETRLFQLYDGTLVLSGCKKLIWHEVEFGQYALQILPKFLRGYSSSSYFKYVLAVFKIKGFAAPQFLLKLILCKRRERKIAERGTNEASRR